MKNSIEPLRISPKSGSSALKCVIVPNNVPSAAIAKILPIAAICAELLNRCSDTYLDTNI